LALLLPDRARPAVERFAGEAREWDGSLAYTEQHEVRREGERVVAAETRYLGPDGKLIARLRSDYARDPYAPDYLFEDFRTGAIEAVEVQEKGVELRANGKRKLHALPVSLPLVTGQGLDRLARERLEGLARGEVVAVELALPSRFSSYEFRMRAVGSTDREARSIRVRFEPSSFLLRLLAPSIEAEYERSTGRLLGYRGVSNVAGGDGETMQVEIRYRYPGDDVPS